MYVVSHHHCHRHDYHYHVVDDYHDHHHRLADSIAIDTHVKSWKIQSKENMFHKNLLFSYCADPSDPTGPLVGAKVKYF